MMASATLAAAAVVTVAFASTDWLTVLGDPADTAVNTIQVNPQPLEVRGFTRMMQVRVSRSAERTSWDGVPYRSYESVVAFDCQRRVARYQTIRYFKSPAWSGQPYRSVNYQSGEPRLMQFRDVQPNPNQKLVSAACGGAVARD